MMSINQEHLPAIVGTLAFLAATSTLVFVSRKKKATTKQRRLSFTSVGLGLGTFPPKCRVMEPIMNVALYFDCEECPSAQDLARLIIQPLLLGYERFSHVPDLVSRTWRRSGDEDGRVNPLDLVRELAVNGDEALVNATIVAHCQDHLGEGRDGLPWWEILILRNGGPGPSACVLRVHHVIGDGLALVAAFEKLLTTEDGAPIASLFAARGGGGKKPVPRKGLASTLWSLVAATAHVLTLATTRYDDDTAFSRHNRAGMTHSGRRAAVIFPTVPLAFVKELKAAAGVTVNDVLMTAVSQAIRDYCSAQRDELLAARGSALQCRGLIPVGFPRDHDLPDKYHNALRNLWCMVSCDLGVGHTDISDRLRHIRAKTTEMKEKPRAFMQLQIQNKLGPYVSAPIAQQTVLDTFSRHSAVITNVPGPTERCRFAGKRIRSVQLFFDNLTTQVDLISYAGHVYGNIVYDADELPELEGFGCRYVAALAELARRFDVAIPPEVTTAIS